MREGLRGYFDSAWTSLYMLRHDMVHHRPFDDDDPRVLMVSKDIEAILERLKLIEWIVEDLDKSVEGAGE